MPDIITHYRFGDAVLQRLPSEVRGSVQRGVYDVATIGPDIWFSYRFWWPRSQRQRPERGDVMQHRQTGEFLLALAKAARGSPARDALFSYLAGFLCHYCLDRAAHPYIIYRSGNYDGTEATLPCRGNHMRLEHALDLRALKRWGKRAWQFPIVRRVMHQRSLPKSMRESLNAAYQEVYGWTGVWTELNRGICDQRRFYFLAQDPCGLLDAILRRVDGGHGHRDLTAISYHGKEQPGVDIANEARLPWRHPFDTSLVSRESFDDLTERATRDAAGMIEAAYSYIACGSAAEELAKAFGDASYETGFDWRDPRNAAEPSCDPLPLGWPKPREGL